MFQKSIMIPKFSRSIILKETQLCVWIPRRKKNIVREKIGKGIRIYWVEGWSNKKDEERT